MNPTRTALAAAVLLACVATARADVKLAEIFGDGMVLQRGVAAPVWGWADPGEEIEIAVQKRTARCTAGADGKWSATLEPLEAGGPYELVVKGKNTIRLQDVLVGDVWVCAGQSNMEWSLESSIGGDTDAAKARAKDLRLFQVAMADSPKRLEHLRGAWLACQPETARGFSAVGYWFGADLQAALHVPIGLIQCTAAGTTGETWTDRAAIEADPALKPSLLRFARKSKANPGALFNGMIGPLAPFAIRGVIWYQGESNVTWAAQYRKLFPALIKSWRGLWGQGDFPFLFVQLPGYGPKPKVPGDSEWAVMREAQKAALELPATGMAVAIDIGSEDLHPKQKREIAARLALVARQLVYGQKVGSRGPSFAGMQIDGREVRVKLENCDAGLRVKGGSKPTGFALAGADKRFFWADARIDGDTIVLRSRDVEAPVAVRYAWSDDPEVSLENSAGLPAEPFRTDDWAPPEPEPAPTGRR